MSWTWPRGEYSLSANSNTSEPVRTFGVTYRKGGQVVELECDASRAEEIWKRIENEFSAPWTAADSARYAAHLKLYPLPRPRS